MNVPRVALRIFLIVLSSCLLLALVAAWKLNRRAEKDVIHLPEDRPPKQAAKFIYEPGAFYVPFRTRGAHITILKPFSQDFSAFGRQNSHGFRTPEYTISHPPKIYRIVILGDAITWGVGVTMESAFPYVLAERLKSRCSGQGFEVIGLGVPGHRFKENVIKLLAYAQTLKPDLVVFQFSQNHMDYYDYISLFAIRGIPDVFSKYRLKQQEVMQEGSLDWSVFVDGLSEVRAWSDQSKIPVCFLLFPPIDGNRSGRNFNNYNPAQVDSYLRASERVITEIRNRNFYVFPVFDSFKRLSDQYLAVSETNTNPNRKAHRIVADTFQEYLFQENLVSCRSSQAPSDNRWIAENALRQDAARKWKEYNVSWRQQVSFFEQLRQIHPDHAWVASQLASVYFDLDRFKDAFAIYDTLDELSPKYGVPWYHMALTSSFQKRRIELLERMIKEVPDHVLAMNFLAHIYLDSKRMKEGCTHLHRVLEIATFQEQYDSSCKLYNENRCETYFQQ